LSLRTLSRPEITFTNFCSPILIHVGERDFKLRPTLVEPQSSDEDAGMDLSLQTLPRPDPLYEIEENAEGFALLRASSADADAFNGLVRRILDTAGFDFVALPRSDGRTGYDGVFILPLRAGSLPDE
jgi:hypothetical protein